MQTSQDTQPKMGTISIQGKELLDEDGEVLRVPMDRPSTITFTRYGTVATWQGKPTPTKATR
jgi:hypothetical protein